MQLVFNLMAHQSAVHTGSFLFSNGQVSVHNGFLENKDWRSKIEDEGLRIDYKLN